MSKLCVITHYYYYYYYYYYCYHFCKGIYNYILGASHVCRVYNVPVLKVYGTSNVIFCNKRFVLSH